MKKAGVKTPALQKSASDAEYRGAPEADGSAWGNRVQTHQGRMVGVPKHRGYYYSDPPKKNNIE
jgi:hypothetical protein